MKKLLTLPFLALLFWSCTDLKKLEQDFTEKLTVSVSYDVNMSTKDPFKVIGEHAIGSIQNDGSLTIYSYADEDRSALNFSFATPVVGKYAVNYKDTTIKDLVTFQYDAALNTYLAHEGEIEITNITETNVDIKFSFKATGLLGTVDITNGTIDNGFFAQ